MPDIITINTYDKIAPTYKSMNCTSDFLERQYLDFERLLVGKRILDVGCGFGRDVKHFIRNNYDVTGIDASKSMVNLAREYVPEAKFYKKDMLTMKFNKKFDGIWCSASLLHIQKINVPTVLNNFELLLNLKGALFIDVKKGTGELYETSPRNGTKRFFAYWSIKELTSIVNKNGFRTVLSYEHKDEKDSVWISLFALKREK